MILVAPRPLQPVEQKVVWVDVTQTIVDRCPEIAAPGLLVTYEEYRKLAANVLDMRAYIAGLEDLVDYYEKQIAIRFPEKPL